MASINNQRYAQWIQGGFSPLARGKKGMKIFNNSINHNLGQRLLSGAALIDNKQMILSAQNGTKIKKKGIKSGINVDYYDPDNVMSVVANNPDKTIVLDEQTIKPNARQRLGYYMKNAPAADIDKVMLGTLALGSAPIAAQATIPSMSTLGDYIAGTKLVNVGNKVITNPYVSSAIESAFTGHGLNHAINEGINGYGDAATTAMELIPLGRLAKPVYEGVVRPGIRLFNSPLTGKWTKISNREYRLSPNSLGTNLTPLESRITTPQITAENAASMTPKQWTAAQDAAIARGDMTEAQRLKELYDQASAKKANLSLYSNLRHDTNSKTWHVFDETKFGSATDDGWFGKGLYLTANPKQIVKGNNHMHLNVFIKKPFLVNKNGDPDRWTVAREFNRGKTYDDWIKENSFSENEIENFFSGFKDNPFGVSESKKAVHLEKDINHENKLRKLFDEMNSSDGVIVSTPKVNLDEVVVPNGRFIKSADVVTYDDNGIRIGLGERNNFNINDNRYSWLPWFLGGSTAATLYNKSK